MGRKYTDAEIQVAWEREISKDAAASCAYVDAQGASLERCSMAEKVLEKLNMDNRFSFRLCVLAGYDLALKHEAERKKKKDEDGLYGAGIYHDSAKVMRIFAKTTLGEGTNALAYALLKGFPAKYYDEKGRAKGIAEEMHAEIVKQGHSGSSIFVMWQGFYDLLGCRVIGDYEGCRKIAFPK